MEELAHLPNHLAIIMDGNGRWAEKRGLSRLEGHRAGIESTRQVVRLLNERGIPYLTLFSFSTENWRRPRAEVNGLLRLLRLSLKKEIKEIAEANIRLRHLGRLDRLSPLLRKGIAEAVALTQSNSGLTLSLAFDYGSRAEIVEAARRIAAAGINPDDIDETLLSSFLYTAGLPDVDLVIRTSGEFRVSNFLLWQSAYAEYYFTDVLWPDFDTGELEKALEAYGQRKRRFGGL